MAEEIDYRRDIQETARQQTFAVERLRGSRDALVAALKSYVADHEAAVSVGLSPARLGKYGFPADVGSLLPVRRVGRGRPTRARKASAVPPDSGKGGGVGAQVGSGEHSGEAVSTVP